MTEVDHLARVTTPFLCALLVSFLYTSLIQLVSRPFSDTRKGVYVVKTYFVTFVVLCVLCAPKIQGHEGHKRCTKNTKNNLCFACTHAPHGGCM